MEEIFMDAPATPGEPFPRWAPARPHRSWLTDTSGFYTAAGTAPVMTNGVPLILPWSKSDDFLQGSNFDTNSFFTTTNDIVPGVHGIKLNHLGFYWCTAHAFPQGVFGGAFHELRVTLTGPNMEDSAMLSAGRASDSLNNASGNGTSNRMPLQGIAEVTDPDADNYIIMTMMARASGSIGIGESFLWLTFMGIPDRSLLYG